MRAVILGRMEILTGVERRRRWPSEKVQRQIDQLELALENLQADQAADQAKGDNQATVLSTYAPVRS